VQDGIRSSRQSLRIRLRCEATIVEATGTYRGETIDIGPSGCRLALPTRWPIGAVLDARISSVLIARPLTLRATVVWVSPATPWTHGLAYRPGSVSEGGRWFDALTSANPELLSHGRVPDRIDLDQRLVVAPDEDLGRELATYEAEVLHHARQGATVRELRARLAGDWSASKRALLGLIDRGALSLDQAGEPAGPGGALDLSGQPGAARGARHRS